MDDAESRWGGALDSELHRSASGDAVPRGIVGLRIAGDKAETGCAPERVVSDKTPAMAEGIVDKLGVMVDVSGPLLAHMEVRVDGSEEVFVSKQPSLEWPQPVDRCMSIRAWCLS